MSNLTLGLLSALLATNQPQAVSNLVQQQTGVAVPIANPNDPAEQELDKLMEADDSAQDEVQKWIRENNAFAADGAGESKAELNKRIRARLDVVRHGYEDFLRRNPDSAHGFLAYGSFLNDIGDEEGAAVQYEKSRQLDPKNPAVWNNLANYYGEFSPVTNAFIYYAKAIELNSNEPVYYENLATTVYLFRTDAREFYHINEQQVFDKSLALYQKAMKLDPDNFPLATDYAQSYYGIKPLRTNDALVAWTNALRIAHDDNEREGVFIHLARIKTAAGFFADARTQLDAVTNSAFADLKNRLEKSLVEHEKAATNPVTATVTNQVPEIYTNAVAEDTNSISVSTSAVSILTNEIPAVSETPTNISPVPTNAIVSTNTLSAFTNAEPTLTNPPVFSTNLVVTLTNVPPVPSKPLEMQMQPPVPRPMPETAITNTP